MSILLHKADPDDALHALADKLAPRIRKAFLGALNRLKNRISLDDLADAVKSGDVNQVLSMLALDQRFSDILNGKDSDSNIESFKDALSTTFIEGTATASTDLVPKLGFKLSFDLANPEATKFLDSYTFSSIKDISANTREGIRSVIMNAFDSGGSPAEQARLIKSFIGLTDTQSKAVSNYRKALSSHNTLRSTLNRALRDGRYDRSIHRAIRTSTGLKQSQIDTMTERYQERYIAYRAMTIARSECLVGETLVDGAVITAVFRRWYEGFVFDIVTNDGRKFTTTPNHPMLSKRGWLFGNEITKSDYLICDVRQKNSCLFGNQNKYNVPTTIREIFDSFNSNLIQRRPCTNADFHGDGIEGYVDTLSTTRSLSIGNFTPLFKTIVEQFLTPSNFTRTRFCIFCELLFPINECSHFCERSERYIQLMESVFNSVSVNFESFCQRLESFTFQVAFLNFFRRQCDSIIGGSVSFPIEIPSSFRTCSKSVSRLFDESFDPIHTYSKFSRNVNNAQSRFIELDRVSSISVRKFSGHVFNLETPYGYFTISGAYTGNSLRASNKGQRALWQQARQQGLLDHNVKRRWIVSGDSNTCEDCMSLDGVVVGLDDEFAPGILDPGDVHPDDRCSQGLVFN